MFEYVRSWLKAQLFKYPGTIEELEGKLVMAGISFADSADEIVEQFQVYGRVIRVSLSEGVVLSKPDATGEFVLPPLPLQAYRRAVVGDYRLRDGGAVVPDPDFTTSWTLTASPSKRDAIRRSGMTGGFGAEAAN